LRECPFPADGDFTWERFTDLYNADLANNLGNLYSRVVTLLLRNFSGELTGTQHLEPGEVYKQVDVETTTRTVQNHIESCQYNQALLTIWNNVLDPANQYAERTQPWSLVKTDKEAAKRVLFDLVECLRVAAILLKPFLPRTSENLYRSFNFSRPYESLRCEDAYVYPRQTADLRLTAAVDASGKVPPLFPRIA